MRFQGIKFQTETLPTRDTVLPRGPFRPHYGRREGRWCMPALWFLPVLRQHRGLKLQDLATRIGRSKAYLSEIECGKKTGSVRVLRAIARTLDVDLDDLV